MNVKAIMTMHPELITICDYLRFATSRFNEAGLFFGHGTDNAWDDALALILPSLHLPININPQVLNAHLTEEEKQTLNGLLHKRIVDRIAVPYLTHQAWFAGLQFYVDERVIIPRSPIAELVLNYFEPWIVPGEVDDILDLCTGSGCIAVACAKTFKDATVDASDISTDALAVAKINVLRHEVESQVSLYHADLFAGLPQKKYDIIVSNPPYVNQEEMASLPPEFIHEPTLSLAAGHEGLSIVMRILPDAINYLKPNGILVIEVGNSDIALMERFPNVPFTWISFERGGGGVFVLTAEELLTYASEWKR